MKKSVYKALRKAQSHLKAGELAEAEALYKQVLELKLGVTSNNHSLPVLQQEKVQELVYLYNQGQFEEVLLNGKIIIKIFPKAAVLFNIMGVSNGALKNHDAAIENYKQAIKIKPDCAEAYYNMGISLINKGELDAAIDSFKKALNIKPDFGEAYNNMGTAFKGKGKLGLAIECYNNALKFKPDHTECELNLIEILTYYIPKKEISHPIIWASRRIRETSVSYNNSKPFSDIKIAELYSTSSNIITDYKIEIDYPLSQTYRRNSVNINCNRHKKIFNKYNIIPKYCFGCYKVQIEPRTVIDLFKLFLLFEQIYLKKNNTRKCIIELRPQFSGFYKGLIYCSSLEEANIVSVYIHKMVFESIGAGIPVIIKRGCAEYPISFPEYKEINHSGPQSMNYNEKWSTIEVAYDLKYSNHTLDKQHQTIKGLSLSDVLIMRNWLTYAQGIGDKSVEAFKSKTIYSNYIFQLANKRSAKHRFEQ